MGLMQRNKGKAGEREVAALISDLTGLECKRRVRQHDGDSDLLGVPGWAVEVKRQKAAPRGLIASWWRQTVEQAGGCLPLLVYRADRDSWRAVWPAAIQMVGQRAEYWRDYAWTAETSLECWSAVARELLAAPAGEEQRLLDGRHAAQTTHAGQD